MPLWQRQCVICRRVRPLAFSKRLAPFGVIGLCDRCRRTVFDELLERCDPATLSEVFEVLRCEDAERRDAPRREGER